MPQTCKSFLRSPVVSRALSGGLYVDPKYADDPKSLDGSAGFMYQEGTVTYYYASKCIEYLGLDESKQKPDQH